MAHFLDGGDAAVAGIGDFAIDPERGAVALGMQLDSVAPRILAGFT